MTKYRTVLLIILVATLFRAGQAFGQDADGCFLNSSDSVDTSQIPGFKVWTNDYAVNAAIQREGAMIANRYGITVRGGFFYDRSPNAFAIPGSIYQNMPADGSVIYGLNLLRSQLWSDAGIGFSVPAILAHEFTHVVQFKRGIDAPTKTKELQADFMAGWEMGRDTRFTDDLVQSVFARFFSMGDYAFNEPDHHGTPKERLAAIKEGYSSKGLSFNRAFVHGLEFAKDLGSRGEVGTSDNGDDSNNNASDSAAADTAGSGAPPSCRVDCTERMESCVHTCAHNTPCVEECGDRALACNRGCGEETTQDRQEESCEAQCRHSEVGCLDTGSPRACFAEGRTCRENCRTEK
jgi:hypothetical protein